MSTGEYPPNEQGQECPKARADKNVRPTNTQEIKTPRRGGRGGVRDATDRGEDYFFLVVVFFAADLVVFFETDFLAAAMVPPFLGKNQ